MIDQIIPTTLIVKDVDPLASLDVAYTGLLQQAAELEKTYRPMARKVLKSADLAHRRQFLKSMNPVFGMQLQKIFDPRGKVEGWLIDRGVEQNLESAIAGNVDLIKTIPKQHLDQVHEIVLRGVADGVGAASIKTEIMAINGQNYNRAKLIARDQIQKFNSVLSQTRQINVGVEKYIWRATSDERTRQTHMDNDGKEFYWHSPPAETGHPGEDINCRCTAEPVLAEILLQE